MRCLVLGTTFGLMAGAVPAQDADMNCWDLATWSEAQAFFEQASPGDPHGLDRDCDGIACESLR